MGTQSPGTTCPVCSAENSEHATVCTSCGSFLRNRVPTLDLFRTAWGILEQPRETFAIVARAEHKNYALFLFAMGGILPAAACFHLFGVGRFFPSLLLLLPLATLSGLVLGVVSAPLAAGAVSALARAVGGDFSFRNSLGASAYALIPAIVTGVVTLPIQWLTFGEFQYTLNPHPETINSVSYWALTSFQVLAGAWSCVLLYEGIRISLRMGRGRAFVPWAGSLIVLAAAWGAGFRVAVEVLARLQISIGF